MEKEPSDWLLIHFVSILCTPWESMVRFVIEQNKEHKVNCTGSPIAQAWKAFDDQSNARDPNLREQLRALGREVARGSRQFALTPPTKADAAAAEVAILPESDAEAEKSA